MFPAKVQKNPHVIVCVKYYFDIAAILLIQKMNMKKITITMALLFAVTIFVSAQNKELEKWANKENAQSSQSVTESRRKPNVVREVGIYLEKSAKYQYGAIGCAGIGTALAITAGVIGTKVYRYDDDYTNTNEVYDKIESDRKLRKGLFIASGISFAAAICCEIVAINYKLKAGRSLRLFSNGTGGGLTYTF